MKSNLFFSRSTNLTVNFTLKIPGKVCLGSLQKHHIYGLLLLMSQLETTLPHKKKHKDNSVEVRKGVMLPLTCNGSVLRKRLPILCLTEETLALILETL